MSLKYFGTDGIRGKFGSPIMNPDFAKQVGIAIALHLNKTGDTVKKIILGRDTRTSGNALSDSLITGLRSHGIECIDLEIVPTPVVAEIVLSEKASMGVMITASHNPAEDNGIKLFSKKGTKLAISEESEIEELIDRAILSATNDLSAPIRKMQAIPNYLISHQDIIPAKALLGWKIAIDTANGATCETTPALLNSLGASIIHIGNQPLLEKINDGVGSEHPEKMIDIVRSQNCKLGFAHDGDGDRLVICDDQGEIVSGEELLGIYAIIAKQTKQLSNSKIVTTKQSNMGLDKSLKEYGIDVIRTDIGDRHVAEAMRKDQIDIGGENSGHFIFLKHSTTGDGMLAALKLIQALLVTGKPLSELRKKIKLFPQLTKNIRVAEKIPFKDLPNFSAQIKETEVALGDQGRILIRYSGTENKLRFLVEANDEDLAARTLEILLDSASKDLHILVNETTQ